MITCKHEEIETIGCEMYINEDDGSMVEEIKYRCLGCSREGVQITISHPVKWFDGFQTKLELAE